MTCRHRQAAGSARRAQYSTELFLARLQRGRQPVAAGPSTRSGTLISPIWASAAMTLARCRSSPTHCAGGSSDGVARLPGPSWAQPATKTQARTWCPASERNKSVPKGKPRNTRTQAKSPQRRAFVPLCSFVPHFHSLFSRRWDRSQAICREGQAFKCLSCGTLQANLQVCRDQRQGLHSPNRGRLVAYSRHDLPGRHRLRGSGP